MTSSWVLTWAKILHRPPKQQKFSSEQQTGDDCHNKTKPKVWPNNKDRPDPAKNNVHLFCSSTWGYLDAIWHISERWHNRMIFLGSIVNLCKYIVLQHCMLNILYILKSWCATYSWIILLLYVIWIIFAFIYNTPHRNT